MRDISRQLDRVAAFWALLGGALLLAIVAVTAVNAGAFGLDKLARFGGATVRGLPGYEDFVRLAIGAASPMFLPYCQSRRGHLSVDLFTARASDRFKAFMDGLGLALIAAFALFLAYWMVIGMFESRSDGAVSRVLGWAEWPFYIPGILSLILWALVAAAMLVSGGHREVRHG